MTFLALVLSLSLGQTPDHRGHIYVLDTEVSVTANEPYICKEAASERSSMRSAVRASKAKQGLQAHGDNVVSIIGSKIDKSRYCIIPVTVFFGPELRFDEEVYLKSLYTALQDPMAVGVNLSQAGGRAVPGERESFSALVKRGVKVVVAAGNESLVLSEVSCPIYPACHALKIKDEDFIVVEAEDLPVSNYPKFPHARAPGVRRGTVSPMSGTSQATAEHTGSLFGKEK